MFCCSEWGRRLPPQSNLPKKSDRIQTEIASLIEIARFIMTAITNLRQSLLRTGKQHAVRRMAHIQIGAVFAPSHRDNGANPRGTIRRRKIRIKSDHILADPRPQDFGHHDGAIGLLIVFQNRDQSTANGDGGSVQCMDKVCALLALRLITNV